MKLCPQCEFIYEDEQGFCDMDGTGLVHNPAFDRTTSRLTIPLVADSASTIRHSSSIVMAAMVVLVLAGLVAFGYFARTRQLNAGIPPQPAQPSQEAADQPIQSSAQPATDPASTAAVEQPSVSPEQARASASTQPDVDATSAVASSANSLNSRLNAGPVSASSAAANNRGPVLIRLTNGATIKADEAWEKGEGVWYRQGGVVTFLKRSRVLSIERVATSRSQSATGNAAATNRPNQSTRQSATRDPLRIAKLEPAKPKKDNRVTSFLKKTGNFFKKPFKH